MERPSVSCVGNPEMQLSRVMLGGNVFGDVLPITHSGAVCNPPKLPDSPSLSLNEITPGVKSIWGAQAFSHISSGKAPQWSCLNWGCPGSNACRTFQSFGF